MRHRVAMILGPALSVGAWLGGDLLAGDGAPPRPPRNLVGEFLGISDADIDARLRAEWHQFLTGDEATERIIYDGGPGEAYALDVNNNDIRSEGLSYGMMIAVQLDDRPTFDRLWAWACRVHRMVDGPRAGSFGWHADRAGTLLSTTAAPDGEEYFATALFFAAGRWGEARYRHEADAVLHAMRHLGKDGGDAEVLPMFHREHGIVVFTPKPSGYAFTDPSYHLPAFYEVWARWASDDPGYWREAARRSRAWLRTACHPVTGLAPDYAEFDGSPKIRDGHEECRADAWRVAMNIGLDWHWWRADPWQQGQSARWLVFFRGPGRHGYHFTVDGQCTAEGVVPALRMMTATANLAAPEVDQEALRLAWQTPTPTGRWRYYDGLLHLLALLHLTGRFQCWLP